MPTTVWPVTSKERKISSRVPSESLTCIRELPIHHNWVLFFFSSKGWVGLEAESKNKKITYYCEISDNGYQNGIAKFRHLLNPPPARSCPWHCSPRADRPSGLVAIVMWSNMSFEFKTKKICEGQADLTSQSRSNTNQVQIFQYDGTCINLFVSFLRRNILYLSWKLSDIQA